MKKIVCKQYGAAWYSAASNDKFCEKCGGKLVEIKTDTKNAEVEQGID